MKTVVSTEEIISNFGWAIRTFKGTSMMPLLKQDKDAVKLVKPDTLKKYDIVLFVRNNGDLVLHRIVKIRRDVFYIRGDNCIRSERIKRPQVIAVANAVYLDGVYHDISEPQIKKYAVWQKLTLPYRVFRTYLARIYRFAFPKKVEKEISVPVEFDYLTRLLGAVLCGKTNVGIPQNINAYKLFDIACKHSVAALAWHSVDKESISKDLAAKWESYANSVLKKDILFDAERQRITDYFDLNGIDYIKLKGIEIKKFYIPKTREYADNDILIRESDATKVEKFMKLDGYKSKIGRIHDAYHKSPVYNFEFHKGKLFVDEFIFAEYFTKVWDSAINKINHEYSMTDFDFVLYNICHMYKHYSKGGMGLRNFVDFYFIKHNVIGSTEFDYKRLLSELNKIGLYDFYNTINQIVNSVFCDGEAFPLAIAEYVYSSGTYGTLKHSYKHAMQSRGKTRFVLRKLFPRIDTMCELYPALKKARFLLPIFWGVRLLSRALKLDNWAKIGLIISLK